ATVREAALDAGCVRTSACPDRPRADELLEVTSANGALHLELVDPSGATVATEVVTVSDPALLDAALAPALDRIAHAAVARAAASTASSSADVAPMPAAQQNNGWVPWVLGGLGVCAGVCALGVASALVYGLFVGANAAGNAAGNSCASACSAPFDGLGDACSGLGNSVGSVGDACSGIGNIGSCALSPALLAEAMARAPDERGAPPPAQAPGRGAMRY
ncbi:MAG TPA: hypothetical protein VGO62_11655, partial [Myxococcota bacterium]